MLGRNLRHKTIFAGASSLALCLGLAAPAFAQQSEAAEDESEEIIVSGIRASLEDAAGKKKKANQIKDVISAEDIGKLPDQNVAEAIQRVTGVQIGRDDAGEGAGFQVRGISQNRVEVNGRSLLPDNPENRNNDFSGISSQLFAGVEVIKSPSASDVEGALGATVRLLTRKPLDTKKNLLSFRVQGQYPELRSGKIDPTVTGLFSTKWNVGDGEMGFLVTASYEDYGSRTEQIGSNGWALLGARERDNTTAVTGVAPNRVGVRTVTAPGLPASSYRPNVFRIQQFDFSRQRIGVDSAFQWAPTPEFTLTIDGNYSSFESLNNEQKIAFNLNSGAQFFTPSTSGVVNVTNASTGAASAFLIGSRVGVDLVSEPANGAGGGTVNQFDFVRINPNTTYGKNKQYGIGVDLDYQSELVDLRLRGSIGRLDNTSLNNTNNFSIPGNPLVPATTTLRRSVAVDYDFSSSASQPPSFVWTLPTGYSFDDLTNWQFSNFFVTNTFRKADEDELRFDSAFHLNAGIFKDLRIGARFAQRIAEGQRFGNATLSEGNNRYVRDITQFNGLIVNMPDPIFQRFAGANLPRSWATLVNLDEREYEALRKSIQVTTDPAELDSYQFRVRERTTALYAQMDFEGALGSIAFRGNFGGRYVLVDQRIQANRVDQFINRDPVTGLPLVPNSFTTIVTQSNDAKSKGYFLPSANIAFEPADDMILRFAYAKTVALPNPTDLSPSYSVPGNTFQARAGNPQLNAYEATQYDVSFEWYFGRNSLFSAAAYYKDVSNFTVDASRPIVLPGRDNNSDGLDDVITLTFPDNGKAGKIKGFEVGLQATFDFLPGFLSGFGAVANFTYTDSSQPAQSLDVITGQVLPLPLLSKKSYNLIGFYEKYGLSLRLAYNHRDGNYIGVEAGLNQYTSGYDQLDFNISYNITKDISVFGSATNLTRSTVHNYLNIPQATRDFRDTGRRFNFGLSARF